MCLLPENIKRDLEMKEMYARAYFSTFRSKGCDIDELQVFMNSLCDGYADSFIKEFGKELNGDTLIALYRYISNFGADNAHSGKRVLEAVYRKLSTLSKESKDEEIKENENGEKE